MINSYYHIGAGSSKAEFPKSVKKYVEKLMIIAGHTDSSGVAFKNPMSRILIHFSIAWPV